MSLPKIAVLISGNGGNLQALIDACRDGRLPGRIVQVISNRPEAYGLQRAADAGIPTRLVDHRAHESRAAFEAALDAQLNQTAPDIIALAGFMRVLTGDFVRRHAGRLINIHPSLLPAHPGLDTHARALAAGDTRHGASVHFVTEAVDGGPVILHGELDVHPEDTPARLQQRVHALEHRIYPIALRWVLDGLAGFSAEDNRLIWENRPAEQPGCLRENGELSRPLVSR